jgi:hypothetical protein
MLRGLTCVLSLMMFFFLHALELIKVCWSFGEMYNIHYWSSIKCDIFNALYQSSCLLPEYCDGWVVRNLFFGHYERKYNLIVDATAVPYGFSNAIVTRVLGVIAVCFLLLFR